MLNKKEYSFEYIGQVTKQNYIPDKFHKGFYKFVKDDHLWRKIQQYKKWQGVYILVINNKIIYCGNSTSLGRRFINYNNAGSASARAKTNKRVNSIYLPKHPKIYFAKYFNLETYLIQKYKPVHNKTEVKNNTIFEDEPKINFGFVVKK